MKLEKLTGRWVNSKMVTAGIREFNFSLKDDGLYFQVVGSDTGPLAGPWGTHKVICYGDMKRPDQFSGFQLSVTIKNSELVLAGNINKGLIIIALYGAPLANKDLSNFFLREFFYKTN